MATELQNWLSQILNGGYEQWSDNGYRKDYERVSYQLHNSSIPEPLKGRLLLNLNKAVELLDERDEFEYTLEGRELEKIEDLLDAYDCHIFDHSQILKRMILGVIA